MSELSVAGPSLGIDILVGPSIPPISNTDVMFLIEPSQSSMINVKDYCLEAFFYYIYLAHPFLLPRTYLFNLLKTRLMPYLEASIRYLGSLYVQLAPTSLLAEEAIHLLSAPLCPRDGFAIQANLLIAIRLNSNTELKRALAFLTQAEDIALEIGMHQGKFVSLNGKGLPVLEESWRRTWQELFVVDRMIAGVHQQSSFMLNEVASTVLLPCEKQDYIVGVIIHSSYARQSTNQFRISLPLARQRNSTIGISLEIILYSPHSPTKLLLL